MSDYERNKGILRKPSKNIDEIFKEIGGELGDLSEDYSKTDYIRDEAYDHDYAVLNGKVYEVDWEAKRDKDVQEFCEVKVIEDGIEFHTYHYNGGAHWTELVERALKK